MGQENAAALAARVGFQNEDLAALPFAVELSSEIAHFRGQNPGARVERKVFRALLSRKVPKNREKRKTFIRLATYRNKIKQKWHKRYHFFFYLREKTTLRVRATHKPTSLRMFSSAWAMRPLRAICGMPGKWLTRCHG